MFYLLFILFLIIGVPISFSMGLAGVLFFWVNQIPLTAIPQRMLGGADSFTLLAIPLYVLAGELMDTGGMSKRIIDLATAFVGHIRGGLGHVVVVATMIFSGISGSSSADTAAIGSIMIPNMVRKGYRREKATAIVAAAGGMGILIPPCINMIVLGGIANLSVATLFFAGFLPAVVMALGIMILVYFEAKKDGLVLDPKASSGHIFAAFKEAFWAILVPIIILGGILLGVFTATEAAVVAVLYALIVSLFIYREIGVKDLLPIVIRATTTTGAIMMLVGAASLFAWITAREQVPDLLMHWIHTISSGPVTFLIITNLVFLVIGAVLEGAPALIILVPLLMPVAISLGIDPIHFGTILIANLGLGFILPPIGLCLLVACGIGKVKVAHVIRPILPYLVVMAVSLVLITYIPWITLIVPKLTGYVPMGNF